MFSRCFTYFSLFLFRSFLFFCLVFHALFASLGKRKHMITSDLRVVIKTSKSFKNVTPKTGLPVWTLREIGVIRSERRAKARLCKPMNGSTDHFIGSSLFSPLCLASLCPTDYTFPPFPLPFTPSSFPFSISPSLRALARSRSLITAPPSLQTPQRSQPPRHQTHPHIQRNRSHLRTPRFRLILPNRLAYPQAPIFHSHVNS